MIASKSATYSNPPTTTDPNGDANDAPNPVPAADTAEPDPANVETAPASIPTVAVADTGRSPVGIAVVKAPRLLPSAFVATTVKV